MTTININEVFDTLDARRAAAQAVIAQYTAEQVAEASRVALLYDRCATTSVKHAVDTVRQLRELFGEPAEKGMAHKHGAPLTLQQLLAGKTIPQLLHWADMLDPNNSWDELTICEHPVTASQLATYMVSAYDNEDVINWINEKA